MTQLLLASIGSYPRIGENKDQQRHRRAVAFFQNKEISAHAFRDVEQSVIQEIVREQIEAGLDEVTDGLVSWIDPISHLCSKLSGFEMTGLSRYFDSNFYYRVPMIVSKPKRKGPLLLPEYQFAQGISNKPVRVVITGPLTLACHTTSQVPSFNSLASRVAFFSEIIANEIANLADNGASLIQIDEPVITTSPELFPLLKKGMETISKKNRAVDARTIITWSYRCGSLVFRSYDTRY